MADHRVVGESRDEEDPRLGAARSSARPAPGPIKGITTSVRRRWIGPCGGPPPPAPDAVLRLENLVPVEFEQVLADRAHPRLVFDEKDGLATACAEIRGAPPGRPEQAGSLGVGAR